MKRKLWLCLIIVAMLLTFSGCGNVTVCPNCNQEIAKDDTFCMYCGYALLVKCPGCGEKVSATDLYCMACGAKITAVVDTGAETVATESASRISESTMTDTKEVATEKAVEISSEILDVGETTSKESESSSKTPETTKTETSETKKEQNTTEAHKHVFTEKIIRESTCISNGEAKYTCSCGYSYTETLNTVDHSFQPTDGSSLSSAEHQCIWCGYHPHHNVSSGICPECGANVTKLREEAIAKINSDYDAEENYLNTYTDSEVASLKVECNDFLSGTGVSYEALKSESYYTQQCNERLSLLNEKQEHYNTYWSSMSDEDRSTEYEEIEALQSERETLLTLQQAANRKDQILALEQQRQASLGQYEEERERAIRITNEEFDTND